MTARVQSFNLEDVATRIVSSYKTRDDCTIMALLNLFDPCQVAGEIERLRYLAKEKLERGLYKDPFEMYGEILTLAPNDEIRGNMLCNRCFCLLKLSEYENGLQQAAQCVALKPFWPKAWFRAAKCLEGMGKTEDALVVYTCALSKTKSDLVTETETECRSDGIVKNNDENKNENKNKICVDPTQQPDLKLLEKTATVEQKEIMSAIESCRLKLRREKISEKYSLNYSKFESSLTADDLSKEKNSDVSKKNGSFGNGYEIETSENLSAEEKKKLEQILVKKTERKSELQKSSFVIDQNILQEIQKNDSEKAPEKRTKSIRQSLRLQQWGELQERVVEIFNHSYFSIWCSKIIEWFEFNNCQNESSNCLFIGASHGPLIVHLLKKYSNLNVSFWIPSPVNHHEVLITDPLLPAFPNFDLFDRLTKMYVTANYSEIEWSLFNRIIFDPETINPMSCWADSFVPFINKLRNGNHLSSDALIFPSRLEVTGCTTYIPSIKLIDSSVSSSNYNLDISPIQDASEWSLLPFSDGLGHHKYFGTEESFIQILNFDTSHPVLRSEDRKILSATSPHHNSCLFRCKLFSTVSDVPVFDSADVSTPFGNLSTLGVWLRHGPVDLPVYFSKEGLVTLRGNVTCENPNFKHRAITTSLKPQDRQILASSSVAANRDIVAKAIQSLLSRCTSRPMGIKKQQQDTLRSSIPEKSKSLTVCHYECQVGLTVIDLVRALEEAVALDLISGYRVQTFEPRMGSRKVLKKILRGYSGMKIMKEKFEKMTKKEISGVGWDSADVDKCEDAAASNQLTEIENETDLLLDHFFGQKTTGGDLEGPRIECRSEDIREILAPSDDYGAEKIQSWCELVSSMPDALNGSLPPGYHIPKSKYNLFIYGDGLCSWDPSGLREGIVPVMRYVHSSLLAPRGQVFPLGMRLKGYLAFMKRSARPSLSPKDSKNEISVNYMVPTRNRITMSAEQFHRLRTDRKLLWMADVVEEIGMIDADQENSSCLRISEITRICSISFSSASALEECKFIRSGESVADCKLSLPLLSDRVNAFVFWAEYEIAPGVFMSCGPASQLSHKDESANESIHLVGSQQCFQLIDEIVVGEGCTEYLRRMRIPVCMTVDPSSNCTNMRFKISREKFDERFGKDEYRFRATGRSKTDITFAYQTHQVNNMMNQIAVQLASSDSQTANMVFNCALKSILNTSDDQPTFNSFNRSLANNFISGCLC